MSGPPYSHGKSMSWHEQSPSTNERSIPYTPSTSQLKRRSYTGASESSISSHSNVRRRHRTNISGATIIPPQQQQPAPPPYPHFSDYRFPQQRRHSPSSSDSHSLSAQLFSDNDDISSSSSSPLLHEDDQFAYSSLSSVMACNDSNIDSACEAGSSNGLNNFTTTCSITSASPSTTNTPAHTIAPNIGTNTPSLPPGFPGQLPCSPYIVSSNPSLQEIFISLANKERRVLEAREALINAEDELKSFKIQWNHILNVDCSPRNSWCPSYSPPTSPRSSVCLNLNLESLSLTHPGGTANIEFSTNCSSFVAARTTSLQATSFPAINTSVRKLPIHAIFYPGMNAAGLMTELHITAIPDDPTLLTLIKNLVLSVLELIMGIPHVTVKTVVRLLHSPPKPVQVVRPVYPPITQHCYRI